MIIRNMTTFEPKLESYTEALIEKGARAPYGSNIYVIADYLKDEYKLHHSYTKDVEKLKAHLKNGNMAIAHVGELTMCGTRGYTMEDLAGALAMVEDGKVRPVIGKILPLTDANEALRMLEEGFGECGRIVLVP